MLRAQAYTDAASQSLRRQREIVWTLFMMNRIYNGACVPTSGVPSSSFRLPLIQAGLSLPNSAMTTFEAYTLSERRRDEILVGARSMTALITELILMWGDTIEFIFQDTTPNTTPIWTPQSRRAEIIGELLDFENSKHHVTGTRTRERR